MVNSLGCVASVMVCPLRATQPFSSITAGFSRLVMTVPTGIMLLTVANSSHHCSA